MRPMLLLLSIKGEEGREGGKEGSETTDEVS
jgi:hypothetical protein